MSSDSKAPVRTVKRVQFGILSPDEIVSIENFRIEQQQSLESIFDYKY